MTSKIPVTAANILASDYEQTTLTLLEQEHKFHGKIGSWRCPSDRYWFLHERISMMVKLQDLNLTFTQNVWKDILVNFENART